MRGILLLAIVLLAGVPLRAAAVDAAKLPGRWKLAEAEEHLSVVYEFRKDGTFEFTTAGPSGNVTISGTWSLQGDKLTVKRKGSNKESVSTIQKLTDAELALAGAKPDDPPMVFRRVTK